jgi:hypothetical protein
MNVLCYGTMYIHRRYTWRIVIQIGWAMVWSAQWAAGNWRKFRAFGYLLQICVA